MKSEIYREMKNAEDVHYVPNDKLRIKAEHEDYSENVNLEVNFEKLQIQDSITQRVRDHNNIS